MKRFLLLSVCLLCCSIQVFSQFGSPEYIKKYTTAQNYFDNENYEKALFVFMQLDSMERYNYNVKFKIGVCYLNMPLDKTKSIPYLEAASKNTSADYRDGSYKERFAPVFTLNYLARAYHLNYEFDKAINILKKTTVFLNPIKDKDNLSDVKRQIEMCTNGKELIATPVNLKIQNLGPNVNSKYPDYSPVLPADESILYFTTVRPETTGGEDEDGDLPEDIYFCTRKDTSTWNLAENIGDPINTDKNDATIGVSVNGEQLIIYKDGPDNGGDIYTSELVGKQWTIPQRLNDNVNSPSLEPSATINADGSLLYFVSDRPGGKGGRDIYRSKRLPNGQWAKPINLGEPINTPYDEDAPVIHPDGVTLFFASKGHNSMGGFDIFFSSLSDSGYWSKPVNMGYPLNTPDDDAFYIPTADNRRGYYASVKEGGYGDKDIYMVTFPDVREKPLAVYKGTIKGFFENDIPEGVQITVTDNLSNELIGRYFPNSKTGKYLFILPPGRNYNISYEAAGFLFHSENLDVPDSASYFVVNTSVELKPIKVGQKITLKNIFFDSGKATLKPESRTELEKLKDLLSINSKLTVEISGHTDSEGKKADNLKLSQKRAEAVVEYLVSNGIPKTRLKAVGYGDTQPIVSNTNADGTPNPDAMEINRRTEVKMISIEGK